MTELSVWAPRAGDAVDVVALGRRTPMSRQDGGWWVAELDDAGPGADYAFSLDGGPPLPDPRSRWQPDGVHGPSRLVDPADFTWTDERWAAPPLAQGLVYEVHIGTFSAEGTLDGAIGHLDYLVDLGVSHVELMPVCEFSGRRGWGYDGVDLFAVHHAYGGPAAMVRFVDACHARGLAVIVDVVYNHLGPAGNYLDRFGPYFTERYRTPWGTAVNYDDAGSDEVRTFVVDNALMWLRDYHCDALRLDAVHAIYDQSATHILEELQHAVSQVSAELGRPLDLIAESDLNDPRVVTSRDRGGFGLTAQWSDDFHHALHTTLTGERDGYYADFSALDDVATALQDVFVYGGRHSAYRARRHGRPVDGLPGTRFLGYLQNHDQVGNRATGDRSSALMSTELLEVGAALVMLSPFVPMLFQGEEWGARTPFLYFTDHEDAQLADAVRAGRRAEFAAFGWRPEDVPDPQEVDTFVRSRLRWAEISQDPHNRLLEWHRALIALRERTPELTDGRLDKVRVDVDSEAGWLMMVRSPLLLVVNVSNVSVSVPLPAGHKMGTELSSQPVDIGPDDVTLPPECAAVLSPAHPAWILRPRGA